MNLFATIYYHYPQLLIAYLVYCAAMLTIPAAREWLISVCMGIVTAILGVIMLICSPQFWGFIGLLILAALGAILVFYLGKSIVLAVGETYSEFFSHPIVVLIGVAIIIGLCLLGIIISGYVVIALVAIVLLYFILRPVFFIVILGLLPGFLFILIQYLLYILEPHPAKRHLKRVIAKPGVDPHDPDIQRVARTLGYDFGLRGVRGWMDAEKRKYQMRQMQDILKEQNATAEEFEKYLRQKHRTQRGDRR